jgi:hypothetical protein
MIDVVSWVGIEGYQTDGNEGLPEVNCVGADGIFDTNEEWECAFGFYGTGLLLDVVRDEANDENDGEHGNFFDDASANGCAKSVAICIGDIDTVEGPHVEQEKYEG